MEVHQAICLLSRSVAYEDGLSISCRHFSSELLRYHCVRTAPPNSRLLTSGFVPCRASCGVILRPFSHVKHRFWMYEASFVGLFPVRDWQVCLRHHRFRHFLNGYVVSLRNPILMLSVRVEVSFNIPFSIRKVLKTSLQYSCALSVRNARNFESC